MEYTKDEKAAIARDVAFLQAQRFAVRDAAERGRTLDARQMEITLYVALRRLEYLADLAGIPGPFVTLRPPAGPETP
jgi:hypothetical protein